MTASAHDPEDSPRRRALLELARRIGHEFRRIELLEQALVHASMGNSGKASNERLEFLGDALLGFVVADHVFHDEPRHAEGQLTDRRSRIVSTDPLAAVAQDLDLLKFLEVGRGITERDLDSKRMHADVVEAILAAIYLDAGIRAARKFVKRHVIGRLAAAASASDDRRDPKSRLLHFVQARGRGQPTYRIVALSGPDHRREFTVVVAIDGIDYGTGSAGNKQRAEMAAAKAALENPALHAEGGTAE